MQSRSPFDNDRQNEKAKRKPQGKATTPSKTTFGFFPQRNTRQLGDTFRLGQHTALRFLGFHLHASFHTPLLQVEIINDNSVYSE
jgi:hypothetical protein